MYTGEGVIMNKRDRAYHAGHKEGSNNQYRIISWSNSYDAWCQGPTGDKWNIDTTLREAREQGENEYQDWLTDPQRYSKPDHIR